MGDLPTTMIPDSQSSAREARQQGGRGGEGRGARVGDVPEAMMDVFQT